MWTEAVSHFALQQAQLEATAAQLVAEGFHLPWPHRS